MVYLGGMLRPIVDHLSSKAWRGPRGDEAGQFLLQPEGLAPGASPESMHATLAALYTHARRWAPGLEVPFFVPPVHVRIDARENAGNFRVEDGYATIGISIDHVGDAEATLLILSHEACHHILMQSRLNHPDNVDLDEVTTDLAMFVCGFGELVLRGHSRVRVNHGEIRSSGVHLGYLSAVEYQEAHDYVLSLRAIQGLPSRLDRATATEAAAPLGISALLADMLDAASIAPATPAPGNDAAPRVEAPRLPSRRRDAQPSRTAAKGTSEGVEWIQLDENVARRHGLPALIPGPIGQRARVAEEGLRLDLCRAWISDFLVSSEAGKSGVWRKKNAALVTALDAFVDKGPLWDKAQKAFAEGDHERAITALKRIASMDPDDHAARLDLAFALAATGDNPGALKAFKAIKKTFEGDPDYHVALGRVHLALEDKVSALNEVVRALEARADHPSALDAMAQMGILDVAEYLLRRGAEAVARAEEKARAEEEARAKEKARARAAAEAEEKALLDARARVKSASILADTPPRPSAEFDNLKTSSGMRDDPLDTARLPGLSAGQRQHILERGRKVRTEEAARMGEHARAEEPAPKSALSGADVPADALAVTRENVAAAAAMVLDATSARADARGRSVRRAAAVVLGLLLAVGLAVLGSRMLAP
jgi:tetratricopeptide (TPR) repeat protein